MKSKVFFLGAIAAGATLNCAAAADAAQLVSWQFDARQNRLIFNTDAGVQPSAKLISNPDRLVIDLPGTRLGRKTTHQTVGGAIAGIRAGQFQAHTARLVVEFAEGYTIDPQQVRFVATTPYQWVAQLPDPIARSRSVSLDVSPQSPREKPPNPSDFQITRNGFFLRLNGQTPKVRVDRSRTRRQVYIHLDGAKISSPQRQSVNRYGVREMAMEQVTPTIVRLTLNVSPDSPDWTAAASSSGVAIVPESGMQGLREDSPAPENSHPVVSQPLPRPSINIPVPKPPPVARPPVTPAPAPVRRTPRTRVVVTLDPGHGGRDPGAIGVGGLQEKNVILPISREVAQILEKHGVTVVLTRRDDRFVSLSGRAAMANRAGSDIFVSIHANSAGRSRTQVNGAETFYYATGRRLAQNIQNRIIRDTGMKNRGVKQARFYVLRHTAMPAALVEVGFVTGRSDAAKLSSPRFRSQMAQAIANGILDYIGR
ncbi:MAG: N-acetylmuramoyl-L-alanine amidase [Spirulina sp.]